MWVAAFVFCISNRSLFSAASQAFKSGGELGSDMIGTLKEPDINWLCQSHMTSPSCQPLTVWVGGFLIFRHLKHSTAYRLKRPSFCPFPPLTSPPIPSPCLGLMSHLSSAPRRPFLEAQLFIDADYLNYPLKSEEYLLSGYFLVQKRFFNYYY